MHFRLKAIFVAGWLYVAGLLPVKGQSIPDSLLKIQQGIGALHWQTSGNTIWLPEAVMPSYTKAGLNFESETGSFRRPQQYRGQQSGGFNGEGFGKYKSWLFKGQFAYHKFSRDSVQFTNVARPYDGNPFITADSVGGNWQGDRIKATLQVATPVWGRWRTGLNLAYEAEQSARNNEPKPLYRYLNVHLQPSVALVISSRSTVSLLGSYDRKTEETETGYFSTNNPPLFSLRGYGTYSRGPVVSADRTTTGNRWQAGAEYLYRTEFIHMLFGFRIGSRRENVYDGIAAPVFAGGLDETNGQAYITFEHRTATQGWLASAEGWLKDGSGFDPVFQAVNPAYYQSGLHGRVGWWQQTNTARRIQINIYPALTYTNYFESIAKTDWTSVMLHADADVILTYHRSKRLLLTVRPLMGYHPNLQADLIINRPTLISDLLVRPDFYYNIQPYWRGTLSAAAVYRIGKTSYNLELIYNRVTPTSHGLSANASGGRSEFRAAVNLIF